MFPKRSGKIGHFVDKLQCFDRRQAQIFKLLANNLNIKMMPSPSIANDCGNGAHREWAKQLIIRID
jgi:hypothetical protein